MSTLSLRVRYRPVRIGWCVREGNLEDIRRAFRLSHTLWGGRYNPVIPIDNRDFARQLIDLFHVDILCPASEDHSSDEFVKGFAHLRWSEFWGGLFVPGVHGKEAHFLDVQHPLQQLHDNYTRFLLPRSDNVSDFSPVLYEWKAEDPLGDVFLATFGAFPPKDETGIDYSELFEKYLRARRVLLSSDNPVPQEVYRFFTPSRLTEQELIRYCPGGREHPGFYVGDVSNFSDLVTFWNLRASGADLLFYDPSYSERLDRLKEAYLGFLRGRPQDQRRFENQIAICSKKPVKEIDSSPFGLGMLLYNADEDIWNGLNVRPFAIHFEEQSVLASVDMEADRPQLSFQLPQKPSESTIKFYRQHLVVSISSWIDIRNEECGFRTPYVPELNEYFGREHYFDPFSVRSEPEGIGIITGVTTTDLTLRALPTREMVQRIFGVFGMKAEPSQPGLIASRLIQQMGGLQGCRVFKISGVREVIEKYSPFEFFTRGSAEKIIGNFSQEDGKIEFSNYTDLVIEKGQPGKLRPGDAFIYLVKKGVFRVGLTFDCPNCRLQFWIALDNARTLAKCEYCGYEFHVAPQLRNRDWRYRRSGLFGREDHQEGGIPVALTLQQLDTTLHDKFIGYTTATSIQSHKMKMRQCETDLVVISKNHEGRTQLVIGESKSKMQVSEDDVENLRHVADAFPEERVEPYILFSKLSSFTPEEIELCRTAQGRYRYRVIMLSDRELEPYFIYERTAEEVDLGQDRHAVCLEDLAKVTDRIYSVPLLG